MAALQSLDALDAHMASASYVEGFSATQADVSLFNSMAKPAESYPNALRWWLHIASFSPAKCAALPGKPVALAAAPATAATPAKPAASEAPANTPKSDKKDKKKGGEKAETPAKEKKEKEAPKKEEKDPVKEAAKEREKLLKKVIKEGGKKGVEIEGASDMGGLEFFCTTIESPDGDLELLQLAMTSMNADPEEGAEDRKGCSGHVGKMVFSAGVKQLAIVSYVPEDKLSKVPIKEWTDSVVAAVGGKVIKGPTDAVSPKGGKVMEAVVEADPDKGKFPLKDKDSAMSAAFAFLRSKGAFPDEEDDDDEEIAFGDDAFEEMGF